MAYMGSRRQTGTFNSEVHVTDDQHYSVERRGLSCSVVYSFRGEAWERFFGVIAANGTPYHWAGAFMGASINGRTVSMPNHFAHDRFLANFASTLAGLWNVKRGERKAVILPFGDKNDGLTTQVGHERARDYFARCFGRDLSEVDDGRYSPIAPKEVDFFAVPKASWSRVHWEAYLAEGDAISEMAKGSFLKPFSAVGQERREEYANAYAGLREVSETHVSASSYAEYF